MNIQRLLYILICCVGGVCGFGMTACSDDLPSAGFGEEEGVAVDAFLVIDVEDFGIDARETRATNPSVNPEPVSEDEKRIDNIWVFQFNAVSGAKLRANYYSVTSESQLDDLVNGSLKVQLIENVNSKIVVVANTSSSTWGSSIANYAALKSAALPNPEPIYDSELKNKTRSIPMTGEIETVIGANARTEIKVTRMYAKLKISFGDLGQETDAGHDIIRPKSIEVNNIPYYCRVGSLGEGLSEHQAATYSSGTSWITRSFKAIAEGVDPYDGDADYTTDDEYVIYVPENLQGEKTMIEGQDQEEVAPENAIAITLTMINGYKVNGMGDTFFWEDVKYTLYPGANDLNSKNNFNVRRNNVYRLKTSIYSVNVHNPSSNCFVVIPGKGLMFEPYYRTEIGGGYTFSEYLTPNEETKKIDKVEIVWQTMDAIGDNSDGKKVKFIENASDPLHSKLYVKTKNEGNALVAARNKAGEILWSWHIWITNNDPGNVGTAINYTTYRWDENGIFPSVREPGYAVMNSNIGALASDPDAVYPESSPDSKYVRERRTSGMLYQWGRKDPFPPAKHDTGFGDYILDLYDNAHEKIAMTTYGHEYTEHKELFETVKVTEQSLIGNTVKSGIAYSIAHPTTFIAAANPLNSSTRQAPSSYLNRGDWVPAGGDDCLWGGIKEHPGMKSYGFPLEFNINGTASGVNVTIRDNYGPDKTIFDPCPAGWRVPPGDLWLGFTKDGKNSSAISNLDEAKTFLNIKTDFNYDEFNSSNIGFWLCLDGWQSADNSKYSFFPCQGTRLASGQPYGQRSCGNYHNATVDGRATYLEFEAYPVDRVNILHLHLHPISKAYFIYPFDYEVWYNVKAIGGPVRCVRDRM